MTEKERELLGLGDRAMCMANDTFGLNGWSHSVSHQSVDFIDFDSHSYEVGVSALVKVTLKEGSFHEHVGFGIAKGHKSKGLCIAKARKLAANDALLNTLRAFGTEFQNIVPSGKITDFISPSQKVTKHSLPPTNSVKRKLVLSSEDNNRYTDCLMEIIPVLPVSSSETQSNNQNRFAGSKRGIEFVPPSNEPEILLSDVLPIRIQDRNISADAQVNSAYKVNLCTLFQNPNCVSEAAVLHPQLAINRQSKESPSDADKRRRKIRQLQLEIEAREVLKNNLIMHINCGDNGNYGEMMSGKNREQDDF